MVNISHLLLETDMEDGLENSLWMHLKTLELMVSHDKRRGDPNGTARWPGLLREVNQIRIALGDDFLETNSPESVFYKAHIINACLELFRHDIALFKKYKAHCRTSSKDKGLSPNMKATYLYLFHIFTECLNITFKRQINKQRRLSEQES